VQISNIIIVYFGLYLLLLATVASGQSAIEKQISDLVKESEFSGAILHYKDDYIAFDKAYGLADLENQIQNSTNHKYNLGSINKLFTKIAVAQLIQQGNLSLEDIAVKYVPELRKGGMEKITIAQLLAMSSGLGDYLDNPTFTDQKEKYLKIEDYLPLISASELFFDPGTRKKYSNLGYELLGIIVGRISQMDYYTYIQTHIFDIVQMNNSGYFTQYNNTTNMSVGYIKTGDTYQSNWLEKSYKGTAAGGGYSTTHDMLNLALALFDNQLLNNTYTNLLFKNFKSDSERDSYIRIAGGGPGINATFYLNRQEKEVVVVFANQDPPAAFLINDIFKPALGGVKKPKLIR